MPEIRAEGVASQVLEGMSQDVLRHIYERDVQLQADEVEKVRAARSLYGLMSASQVARFVGASSEREIASMGPREAESSVVLTAISMWSAASMHALSRTWLDLVRYAESSGQAAPSEGRFSGRFVQAYQRHVDSRSRLQFRLRHVGQVVPPGSARGGTASGGSGSRLRTLSRVLHFLVDVSSTCRHEAP